MTTNPAPPVPYDGPIHNFDDSRVEPVLIPLRPNHTATRLSTLVLSKRKRVNLTRDELMTWIATDGDADAVLDQVVALFNRDEG